MSVCALSLSPSIHRQASKNMEKLWFSAPAKLYFSPPPLLPFSILLTRHLVCTYLSLIVALVDRLPAIENIHFNKIIVALIVVDLL